MLDFTPTLAVFAIMLRGALRILKFHTNLNTGKLYTQVD
jgi:hypothetical protein